MSDSRVIVTNNKTIFVSHICSQCGFPVTAVVSILAESQKSYVFSEDKASQIAADTAYEAVKHEIERIELCKQNRCVLLGKENKSDMIAPGYFCESSFSGHQEKCPYCGNIEPWQSKSQSNRKMEELSDENFPVVFIKREDEQQWVKEIILSFISSINSQRQNNNVIEKAITNALILHHDLDHYLELSTNIKEKKQLSQLEEKLKNYECEKGQLGLLDFKIKKEVNTSIKALKLEIDDTKKTLLEKDTPIQKRIQEIRQKLLYEQSVAFGCESVIVTKYNGSHTFTYLYSANDIPKEVLDKDKLLGDIDNVVKPAKTECGTEQKPSIMFCRKCGYKLLPNSAFCSKCGAEVL